MTARWAFQGILLGGVLGSLALGGCDFLAGPQAEVASALRASASVGKSVSIPGCGTMTVTSSAFDRFVAKRVGENIVAIATVDLEGVFSTSGARVSYLGREELTFVHEQKGGWKPREVPLPRLTEALVCMCASSENGGVRSEDSIEDVETEKRDATVQEKSAQVARWIVRTSKKEAIVLEENALGGRRRVVLTEKDGRLCAPPFQTTEEDAAQSVPLGSVTSRTDKKVRRSVSKSRRVERVV